MKKSELERRWRQAVQNQTPNVLPSILERCTTEQQEIPTTSCSPTPRKKQPIFKWAAVAAAMCVMVFCVISAYTGYNFYHVSSIVDLDVNPGIELNINRDGRVLSAFATDADGQIILDDMDLKNTDMNLAVNALIGSMLKHGYLTDLQNSILISVRGDDATKNEALQQQLEADISAVLSSSSIDGAILNQSVSVDDNLQALSEQYGISVGKAVLIQSILEKIQTGHSKNLPDYPLMI